MTSELIATLNRLRPLHHKLGRLEDFQPTLRQLMYELLTKQLEDPSFPLQEDGVAERIYASVRVLNTAECLDDYLEMLANARARLAETKGNQNLVDYWWWMCKVAVVGADTCTMIGWQHVADFFNYLRRQIAVYKLPETYLVTLKQLECRIILLQELERVRNELHRQMTVLQTRRPWLERTKDWISRS